MTLFSLDRLKHVEWDFCRRWTKHRIIRAVSQRTHTRGLVNEGFVKVCGADVWWRIRLRNDLYCVEWGVKLYSLTRLVTQSVSHEPSAADQWNARHVAATTAGFQWVKLVCDVRVGGNEVLSAIVADDSVSVCFAVTNADTPCGLQGILRQTIR